MGGPFSLVFRSKHDRENADGLRGIAGIFAASLKVDYLKPTPLGPALELRGTVKEQWGRKVLVSIELSAEGMVTARGEVVAVQVPQKMLDELMGSVETRSEKR